MKRVYLSSFVRAREKDQETGLSVLMTMLFLFSIGHSWWPFARDGAFFCTTSDGQTRFLQGSIPEETSFVLAREGGSVRQKQGNCLCWEVGFKQIKPKIGETSQQRSGERAILKNDHRRNRAGLFTKPPKGIFSTGLEKGHLSLVILVILMQSADH